MLQRQRVAVYDKIVYLHKELAEKMHKIGSESEVDSKMSTFYNGTTLWSPQIQTYQDRTDYWHSILQIKTGVDTSKNEIKIDFTVTSAAHSMTWKIQSI